MISVQADTYHEMPNGDAKIGPYADRKKAAVDEQNYTSSLVYIFAIGFQDLLYYTIKYIYTHIYIYI